MSKNLYQRNGVYYARLQVDGAEKRGSLKTKDKREAERRLKQFREEHSLYHGTIRRTFDDVMDGFLIEAKSRLKPKTYKRYEVSALQLGNKFSGQWWDAVTKAAVVEYIDERKAEGTKIPTIKRDLTVLSQASEWAIDRIGGVNPVALIGKRQLRHKRYVFTLPNVQSLDATISSAYGNLKALARFLLATGMRLDEGVNLRWDDVDRDRAAATLHETKSGRPRAAILNPDALAILKGQSRQGEWVFPTRLGGPYKQASTNWQEAKAKARKAAQNAGFRYTPMRLHDLRHIYAIRFLTSGGNLYALQRQLGHGTIRQTEEYLDYLTPDEADDVKRRSAQ